MVFSEQITSAGTDALIVMLREGLTVIGLLTFLLYQNWKLTLILLIAAPLVGLVVNLTSKRFRHKPRPGPGAPATLRGLVRVVAQERADLGLAFDGDGDRLGVVLPNGTVIYPDILLMALAEDMVARHPGAKVIFDVKCTGALFEVIRAAGGEPEMWRTGHSLINARMKETGALLAGEMSGHIFFGENWYGFDDGLLAAVRLLDVLGRQEQDAQAFFEHSSTEDQMHAVYYGILITVIFFNLFIFAALREPVYLLYVLSTLGYLLLIGSLNGTTFQFLWPHSPALQNQIMLLAVPFSLLFTLIFSRSFLKLEATGPVLNRLVVFMVSVNAVVGLMTFFLDYSTGSRLTVALAIPSCLLLTVLGPVQWWKGNPQAGYYTVAWAALTLGSAITAANKYGLLPNNFVTTYGMQIGSALEAILLTLALAARLYQERQDKVEAREAELKALAARRSAELKLMDHALHNPLTGLPNRGSLEMMLNDLMIRSPERRYGIAVIHLNNLQSVTKTLGHRNSDRILELASKHYNAVARELPGTLPVEQSDQRNFYLASLDPQTFAFIVDADATGAVPRAILKALEGIRYPIDYLGMQIPLDPRLGVAIFPEHGTDANTLIRRAVIAEGSDSALERGIAYYKSKKDSYSADRLTMVSELRHALNTNELVLFMQPKQSLKTGRIVGVEVLIRWPGRAKPIRADEIITLAEQTGLIKPLTRWVLEQSLELRSRLLDRGWPMNISINISPNNLREPDFPIFVQRLMNSYHSHQGAIIFEVTETSMMQDPGNSLKALNSLSATGIPVSVASTHLTLPPNRQG